MSKKPDDIRPKDITGKECMVGKYIKKIDCVELKFTHPFFALIPRTRYIKCLEEVGTDNCLI